LWEKGKEHVREMRGPGRVKSRQEEVGRAVGVAGVNAIEVNIAHWTGAI